MAQRGQVRGAVPGSQATTLRPAGGVWPRRRRLLAAALAAADVAALQEVCVGPEGRSQARELAEELGHRCRLRAVRGGRIRPRPDGALGMKWPWWRGVAGALSIEGRRLDGPAAPLRAQIPDGYGDRGFQVTGLLFPSEGCWEVTGRAGGAALTFVTRVVRTG
jgi:hypothetical protein